MENNLEMYKNFDNQKKSDKKILQKYKIGLSSNKI